MNLWKKWTGISLVLRILIGVVLGAALGLLVPSWKGIGLLGEVFVGALKALAPVLVAILVAASIARSGKGLGKRFLTVIVLYLSTTLLAALVAVGGSFLFPVTLQLSGATAGSAAPGSLAEVFRGLLTNMVNNPISAISSANYIGILFWAIVAGAALKAVASETTLKVVGDLADMVSLSVGWVIQFAPFGILGLVFKSVADGGLDIFTTYGRLLALLVGCMVFVYFGVNPLIHALLLRRNPWPLLLQCLRDSGVNAFFIRSSAANIPVNMELCRRLGLDREFYSVSIPLGATINMEGAAVTITVITLAVTHTLGIEVGFASALVLCVVSALAACGTSGVAGGSLLLVPMACSLFGIGQDIAMQAVGIGFIIGVVQDSVETAVNSSADAFFTATAEMLDRKRHRF